MKYTRALTAAEEGGCTVRCLQLPAAISEGDTKEEALEKIKEAIELVLEVTQEKARIPGEVTTVDVVPLLLHAPLFRVE
ncbi:type II toxin-antitoxin system HicB family antitoxin [Methanocalculus sp.]|uniref:type II toxin-antitoxin system HicB family antitoxin n=1 Tax=Methanocalculus sp. TaxID=2004547 RepID=UPI002638D39D|nr:type II toxin-antitoxin system HicB family antitoxin [Methanocalculus sp.]MDG6250756.1 type II toxin-antitoxin system HicB family antitoxin [Methanocalculus sp.]